MRYSYKKSYSKSMNLNISLKYTIFKIAGQKGLNHKNYYIIY